MRIAAYILYLYLVIIHNKNVSEVKYMKKKFTLSEFINKYKRRKAPFGFNGLGELVYMRLIQELKIMERMNDGGKLFNVWSKVLTRCK